MSVQADLSNSFWGVNDTSPQKTLPVVQDLNVLEGGTGKVQKEWDHHAPSVLHYLYTQHTCI